ncbi:major capsid protein [uncultured Caudovirales phage]|uniref:Major capsid protein n=1 Tax=uncultured Caudovirales phage TaxID=2100421 RepID=A0A6J5KTW1_9CAUD|nr:major capsid protein [uncultured Caudovirales phage]
MYLSEAIQKKWAPILDHGDLPAIEDPYRRAVTAIVLENQERALREESGILSEAPASGMSIGGGGYNQPGYGSGADAAGPVAGFDPILISLVRRSLPNLMAYDICGVQPMTGPTGLIFAMRSVYPSAANAQYQGTNEALYQEANTAYSGRGAHSPFAATANANAAISGGQSNTSLFGLANTGYGFTTASGEALAEGSTMASMGFSIEKVTVTANTRALAAAYTLELAQDLKAVHGLDAETELANILSTEILAEINREVVRTVYATAKPGAQLSAVPGLFNLATGLDTDGRWQVEKYKGLIYQIERDSNKIAKDTRRGKGNMIICSTDVASALAMSGLLDYNSALSNNTNLSVDDTGNTFAGTLFGRVKVYVDPYSVSGADYVVVGYKGNVAYDAGLFYCPYVPLQMVRAIDPATFQPKIGFKTRYGLVANPFAELNSQGLGRLSNNSNVYYRKFIVANLK